MLCSLIVTGSFAFGNGLAEQNRNRIISLQRMVMEQNERLDGLASLMEGLSASVAELKMAKQQQGSTADNNETLKLIRDLGTMIDEINRKYVSREELRQILASEGKTVSKERKKGSGRERGEDNKLETETPSKLYSEGVRFFVKKRYDEAAKRFLLTAKKGYKPAASNYYLGEIAYYTKQYEDAVFYYKKSAGIYDQAAYMDVLLLHTAISLDKKGEKEQAKIFYDNVIENYPKKRSASIAKERRKRL
jgi:TolA-binding protein